MKLNIGYKNYSSWSLRPWLLMKEAEIEFEEIVLPIFHDNSLAELASKLKVPAQVPILEAGGNVIWDSLAIAEYLAEQYSDKVLWPAEPAVRSLARSASAEMHSGFQALRSQCPMNCRASKRLQADKALSGDLQRLAQLWEMFKKHKTDGDFLCGKFGIVDAMYAPIGVRVRGYNLSVSPAFNEWNQALFALPSMQQWIAAAKTEPWKVESYDAIGDPA